MPMDWTTIQIPLAAGLAGKGDPRAKQPPALEVCRNVEFDDVGGLLTRKPYAAFSTDIFNGATIADPRRLVENGDELLLFTKSALYSWSEARASWVEKGEHLAAVTAEASRFVTTGDQIQCDRAECGDVVFYAWCDGTVYVAAMDATTGAVIMSPTETAFSTSSRPRLVALDDTVLLFLLDASSNLLALEIDPADPEAGVTGSATVIRSAGAAPILGELDPPTPPIMYDVCRRLTENQAFAVVTHWTQATYTIAQVPSPPSGFLSANHGRPCEGPIAVASDPTGNVAQVIRVDDDDIEGDQIVNTTLAAFFTNTAIGTIATAQGCHQIAAAFRSVQTSGSFRCYVFWSFDEDQTGASPSPKTNWVNIANAVGTEDDFPASSAGPCSASATTIGSRAFDRDGSVYVAVMFAGASGTLSGGPLLDNGGRRQQLQNTYFLYRDDGFLVGKIAANIAGGFALDDEYTGTAGHLPGVVSIGDDTFAWCATERRLLTAGGSSQGYSARAPRDVLVSFDDDRARRCVRLGLTLYVTGALILQYDGEQLVDVGFSIYPWYLEDFSQEVGAGDVEDGTYAYKETYRWDNAQGERERSTTATRFIFGVAGGPVRVFSDATSSLPFTRKLSFESPIAVEQWRTLKDPTLDAPFYAINSLDPNDLSGTNHYRANGDLGLNDALEDDDLANAETSAENGDVLEQLAPPAATIIAASQERIFLAGVSGDPDRVWYSRKRGAGEIASFNDALTVAIPPEGGAITALLLHNETLVVCREHATYVVGGDGFDNLGRGENYGPARRAPGGDVGALSQESAAICDAGVLMKTAKGWYILGGGWALQYVGAPVADFDDEEVVGIDVIESQHQIRCLTRERLLVLDTLVSQWGEWTIAGGLAATMWRGVHVYLAGTTAYRQLATHAEGVDYGIDIETPWIKINDLQGRGRVRRVLVLGEWRSAHRVRARFARDYQRGERILATVSGFDRPVVCTLGDWTADLEALEDDVTMSIAFVAGGPAAVELRDDEDFVAGVWIAAIGNVGLKVTGAFATPATVGMIETAIATSELARVATPAAVPSLTISHGNMNGARIVGAFPSETRWFGDTLWTPDNTVPGSTEQPKFGPAKQRCEAFKVRLTAMHLSTAQTPPTGEALRLTGLGLEVGIERGLHRRIPSAQKAG